MAALLACPTQPACDYCDTLPLDVAVIGADFVKQVWCSADSHWHALPQVGPPRGDAHSSGVEGTITSSKQVQEGSSDNAHSSEQDHDSSSSSQASADEGQQVPAQRRRLLASMWSSPLTPVWLLSAVGAGVLLSRLIRRRRARSGLRSE